jgi:hypothetical protein
MKIPYVLLFLFSFGCVSTPHQRMPAQDQSISNPYAPVAKSSLPSECANANVTCKRIKSQPFTLNYYSSAITYRAGFIGYRSPTLDTVGDFAFIGMLGAAWRTDMDSRSRLNLINFLNYKTGELTEFEFNFPKTNSTDKLEQGFYDLSPDGSKIIVVYRLDPWRPRLDKKNPDLTWKLATIDFGSKVITDRGVINLNYETFDPKIFPMVVGAGFIDNDNIYVSAQTQYLTGGELGQISYKVFGLQKFDEIQHVVQSYEPRGSSTTRRDDQGWQRKDALSALGRVRLRLSPKPRYVDGVIPKIEEELRDRLSRLLFD